MTAPRQGDEYDPAFRRLGAILSDRLGGLSTLLVLLLLTWGTAGWLLHQSWQERREAALRMVDDQAREAEITIGRIVNDADRTLLALRLFRQTNHLNPDLTRVRGPRDTGGIAFVAPNGEVLAASADASTSGWAELMSRLANSSDVLVIGEAIPGDGGRGGSIPIARRLIDQDGGFGGIVMSSLDAEALFLFPPAIMALRGCATLIDERGRVLARTGDARPNILPFMVSPDDNTGSCRHAGTSDGVDRLFSYRRIAGLPVTVVTGVGRQASLAGWESARGDILAAAAVATGGILATGLYSRVRRRRIEFSANALPVILAHISDGVRVTRPDGAIAAANQGGRALDVPARQTPDPRTRRMNGKVIRTSRHILPGGGAVVIGTDLTALREAEARAEFLTHHDLLTGLPNRWRAASRIQERIGGRVADTPRTPIKRTAALILLDLDGFQEINDTFGHEAGDEVLVEVAARLRELITPEDMLARLGGDEFLLFLDKPDSDAAVASLSRRLNLALARPIVVRDQPVRLGATLGVAFFPRDGTDAPTLFRHADIALSQAKRDGRGGVRTFEPAMMAAYEENRMVESDLRRALDNNELDLRLQPQFACDTLEVTGFEALARWRHPTRGELSPAVFIPVAERSGLINPLGLWAIEKACEIAASWQTRQRIAVNISPIQLHSETIPDDIQAILRRTQFPPHLLELEVTENVLLDEDQRSLEALHKLRAMDIRITLDDFGTGYSSLSYLRRFPFDKVKIDKSFIQSQSTDRATRVILESMIRMCSELGFDVVAEGVETDQQLEDLRRLGCEEIQGFLLAKPLRPEGVEAFLAQHKRRAGSGRTQTVLLAPS